MASVAVTTASAQVRINPHSTEKERKIGHRRVDDTGQVSYKRIQTNQLQSSIQLGIQYSIGAMFRTVERDLLMQDFMTVETISFPSNGSQTTPAHTNSDFTFRSYAPLAFRYFLKLFGVRREDFMMCLCNEVLRELTNPGASGSIFYLTQGDEFILKTVQYKESLFLQKLLPGYYMNLNQNLHTLLPKFFGMYCYQCNQKNIRLTVMNNLLPSNVKIHLKFDLKGSTYKRKASKSERSKSSPTYKDLDFIDMFHEGLLLEHETYTALINTLRRDCLVLESFRIMDYSLLVGIHNLDAVDTPTNPHHQQKSHVCSVNSTGNESTTASGGKGGLQSNPMESIQAHTDPIDHDNHIPSGGIPARNDKGERLLLFLGIIDILQSYRLRKRVEHTLKSVVTDGDTVSVHRPSFYASRFLDFMANRVFKKIPSPLKHSPSRRNRSTSGCQQSDEMNFIGRRLVNSDERNISRTMISASDDITQHQPSTTTSVSNEEEEQVRGRMNTPFATPHVSTDHEPVPHPSSVSECWIQNKTTIKISGGGETQSIEYHSTPPLQNNNSKTNHLVTTASQNGGNSSPSSLSNGEKKDGVSRSDLGGLGGRFNSGVGGGLSMENLSSKYVKSSMSRHEVDHGKSYTALSVNDVSQNGETSLTRSFKGSTYHETQIMTKL